MKIGIIDDDTQFSQVIKHKIEENTCFSKSRIDVFNNDFKSLQLKDYDYLFIDILLMQDNGITIAKSIHNKNTRIIFMSSNETLVYDCFDIALYFFIRKTSYEDDLERLFIKIDKDQNENHKQYLVDKKNNQYINLKDIIYVQSHRNTCTFYTEDNEYVQYTTLKKCFEELCSNVAFYKINSYTIINFKYVIKINNQSVTLMNSQTFNVSRKSKDIIEKYHAYRRYMQ